MAYVRYVKLVNIGVENELGAKGFDTDAFEALNSVSNSITDGCNEGNDGRDILSLSVTTSGSNILVTLQLCATAVGGNTKYRVHFDYDDANGLASDVTRDGTCLVTGGTGVPTGTTALENFNIAHKGTTSDDTMMHRGHKDTGPGAIDVSGSVLDYTVSYSELGLVPGDLVLVWADVHWKGIVDRAPDTDDADGCAKPTGVDEVIGTVLN